MNCKWTLELFFSVLYPKNAKKLWELEEFFWWSANRENICQVLRESEKVENR